jgi:FixJ family two-component response regulator
MSPQPVPRKTKVTVVDDDASVLKALDRLLRSAGICVRTYDSPEACLAGDPPGCDGCLIVDYRMTGMTGFDLVKALRQRGSNPPFIVISAHDDAEARQQARDLGASAYFRKPVDGQALLDAISWATGEGM